MTSFGGKDPFPCSMEEDSSFHLRKSRIDGGQWNIWRTRSLDDEANSSVHRDARHGDSREGEIPPVLHSSFDAALLLDKTRISGSLFGYEENLDLSSRSFFEEDVAGDLSGKKHLRQRPGLETLETNLPGIVRKQPRVAIHGNSCSVTPAGSRFRPAGSVKKSTPSSALKRRREPLIHQRKSPSRRNSHPLGLPSTNLSTNSPSFGMNRIEDQMLARNLTPIRQTTFGSTSTTKSTTKWYNTGTTASTALLETTFESDSVDTSSPTTTRFRFTSFPASLPRVNNPRTRQCPDSVCKRMSFNEIGKGNALNQSREDDGTHNTSISSLSAEGAKGFEDADHLQTNHTQLFPYEENLGYSDEDTVDSPVRGNVGRTRLNFNALSPICDSKKVSSTAGKSILPLDLNMPYDQQRINSFPSSLSSNTHMNFSSCEDVSATLTPARPFLKEQPSTPHEVQLHFPPETECSPIPGDDPFHPSTIHEENPCLSKLENISKVDNVGYSHSNNESNQKEEGSIASESTNSKSRRLRPMPDISAFESVAMSSRGDRSGDDSATLDSSKGVHSAQRLLCPPTPVRTPAWASEGNVHAFFGGRQNSLITTKVLLACPSQVLEGRNSLEGSLLDDDSKGSGGCQDQGSQISALKHAIVESAAHNGSSGKDLGTTIPQARIPPPSQLMQRIPSSKEEGLVVSFSKDFEVLVLLGSGAFADVYKVRSKRDGRLYAVKRNRRQFRGKRDRDMALAEVQYMQRLQNICAENGGKLLVSSERNSYCLYLLFFYRAWQEDGYFFCQTELCCRDTCRELLDSLRLLWNSTKSKYPSLLRNVPASNDCMTGSASDVSGGRSIPTATVWKIIHDVAAGLSHIHSHGLVHNDIKPSNIFFVLNPRFGAMCKIGDFGMAGDIGSQGDGLEGDARYMPPELLSSITRQPSADIFSLGLTLYEVATENHVEMPSEGPQWHELRSDSVPKLPEFRGNDLIMLIKSMTDPNEKRRPKADDILQFKNVAAAGHRCDVLLRDYILDIEEYDRMEEERLAFDHHDDKTPRNRSGGVRSPSLSMLLPAAPNLLSPVIAHHPLR